MSTGSKVKMSGMPDRTTHFLPMSLNRAWLTIILCVGAVKPEVLYDIPSLGWQGKKYIVNQRDTGIQGYQISTSI